ncbi:hypothetical protein A2U01_0038541, partial [Trifolium medium]|nr:hypothetical protein [Trifolium medium]
EGEVENESEGVVEEYEKKGVVENESEIEEVVESRNNGVVENKREKNNESEQEVSSKKEGSKDKVKTQEEVPYPRIPYPRKKKLKTKDHHFKKFMKMLNSLQVNLPLAEALEQMPLYAKFLKELLTKKRKPLDDDTVDMTEECSALIQKKLPQKKKDPGSFTIPCSIGNLTIGRALCDLGASINLMTLSMMKKILTYIGQ